jgi:hypothetical protein
MFRRETVGDTKHIFMYNTFSLSVIVFKVVEYDRVNVSEFLPFATFHKLCRPIQ